MSAPPQGLQLNSSSRTRSLRHRRLRSGSNSASSDSPLRIRRRISHSPATIVSLPSSHQLSLRVLGPASTCRGCTSTAAHVPVPTSAPNVLSSQASHTPSLPIARTVTPPIVLRLTVHISSPTCCHHSLHTASIPTRPSARDRSHATVGIHTASVHSHSGGRDEERGAALQCNDREEAVACDCESGSDSARSVLERYTQYSSGESTE
jgi:hypothetical protein